MSWCWESDCFFFNWFSSASCVKIMFSYICACYTILVWLSLLWHVSSAKTSMQCNAMQWEKTQKFLTISESSAIRCFLQLAANAHIAVTGRLSGMDPFVKWFEMATIHCKVRTRSKIICTDFHFYKKYNLIIRDNPVQKVLTIQLIGLLGFQGLTQLGFTKWSHQWQLRSFSNKFF